MVNLDLRIGNLSSSNNGVVAGFGKDVGDIIANSAGAVANVVSPTLGNVVQNTSKLTRNPWKTLTTGSSYANFAKTFPAAAADLLAKTSSLPFRTAEGALTYGIANNLERIVGTLKGVSTDAVRNWFHNGGEANGFMRGMGHLFGGAGDLVGSIIKAPAFIPEWSVRKFNDLTFRPMITKTESWVKNQRLSDVDYFQLKVLANDNYAPTSQSNAA